jgi:AmmeMemoRadiSam system protein B
VIVVSSDLSHFHDYATAQRRDAETAAAIERGIWADLGPGDACGYLAIAGLLIEATRRGLKARRLALCNSGDTAGARDRVVGYGAWLFEDGHPSK